MINIVFQCSRQTKVDRTIATNNNHSQYRQTNSVCQTVECHKSLLNMKGHNSPKTQCHGIIIQQPSGFRCAIVHAKEAVQHCVYSEIGTQANELLHCFRMVHDH